VLASLVVSIIVSVQIKSTPSKKAPTGWDPLLYMGRTPQEIVELGREKWCQQHKELIGKTPSDMANANFKFEKAQRVVNLELVRKLSQSEQIFVKKLRVEALEYGKACQNLVVLGCAPSVQISWKVFHSKVGAEMEELLFKVIRNEQVKDPIDASFTSLYKDIEALVKTKNKPMRGFQQETLKVWTQLKKSQIRLLNQIKNTTKENRLCVQDFMKKHLWEAKSYLELQ